MQLSLQKDTSILLSRAVQLGPHSDTALDLPRADVYVVDMEGSQRFNELLLAGLVRRRPTSQFVAVAESFDHTNSFPILRLGVKGLVPHALLRSLLRRAVHAVAGGGYWVPRVLLSNFVDSILQTSRHRAITGSRSELSKREAEVKDALLENLANKEIADRLNISERTVKFHVSNVLKKYGVRRRADLILLGVQSGANASILVH
ncbi:MAG: helix-turn-helix domain-containing protein [Terriglobales bacterium]